MKITTRAAVLIAALAVAGACTPRAGSVQPVSMGNAYDHLDCMDAYRLLQQERQNVTTLSAAQNSAATGDAIGVFLIGVPMANVMGGNRAGDLGAAKGKVIALEQRLLTCP